MKTLTNLLAGILCTILLIACGKDQHVGKLPDTSLPALHVSDALQAKNIGRVVRISGAVQQVCQEEGCWMVITDGKKKLRVTFKDEAFTVPMALKGDVYLEGVVTEDVYDQETAKAMAETISMSRAEIDGMHGDQRMPMLVATGVYMETPPSE